MAKARNDWLDAAGRHRHGKALITYFHLLEYVAQRPGDVLAMRWDKYDGQTIELVQEKTGKPIRIACHKNLRRVLEATKRNTNSVFIVAKRNGQPFSSVTVMNTIFRKVCNAAGIGPELQARDLRRTAAVRLREAGCTDLEIVAITGHSIERTKKILQTYLPPTAKASLNAVEKWERNEK